MNRYNDLYRLFPDYGQKNKKESVLYLLEGEDNPSISILSQLRTQFLFVGFKHLLFLYIYICCMCWIWNWRGEIKLKNPGADRSRTESMACTSPQLCLPPPLENMQKCNCSDSFLQSTNLGHGFTLWLDQMSTLPCWKGNSCFLLSIPTFTPCSLPSSMLPRLPTGFGTHLIRR